MATISENLQIIADSTSAIKQAIMDKGGEITGDITTWAEAIMNIQSAPQQTENKITFTSSGCTAAYPVASNLTITVLGRKTSDSASSQPYSFDIYIPIGQTASTSTRTIFNILEISPSQDSTYIYTY